MPFDHTQARATQAVLQSACIASAVQCCEWLCGLGGLRQLTTLGGDGGQARAQLLLTAVSYQRRQQCTAPYMASGCSSRSWRGAASSSAAACSLSAAACSAHIHTCIYMYAHEHGRCAALRRGHSPQQPKGSGQQRSADTRRHGAHVADLLHSDGAISCQAGIRVERVETKQETSQHRQC